MASEASGTGDNNCVFCKKVRVFTWLVPLRARTGGQPLLVQDLLRLETDLTGSRPSWRYFSV